MKTSVSIRGRCVKNTFLCRYFGTAEGSRFVEYASADSVKRTWVNYGLGRDWVDTEQGQVCLMGREEIL